MHSSSRILVRGPATASLCRKGRAGDGYAHLGSSDAADGINARQYLARVTTAPEQELGMLLVGLAGFEPATPCSQSRCATKLRYSPCGGHCGM